MRRALFTEEEVRLATERRLKYLGTAKVSIAQIQFEPPLPRDLDPKNLTRLREIFRKNHCRRLDVDNHVPAIVSRQDLAVALHNANVSERSLLTNDPTRFPELKFAAGQLRALHGRHRVQAAAEVLPPADRWWTIDLYLDDIGEELRTSLLEEYANQKKPTDGEIYRKIRQYEGEGNEAFRERWFVRLSPSNQDRLDQLDNRRNRRLRRAFDRLLSIPGLWPNGMRISMLHRLIATGCIEEIITYLDHIEDFWSSLVASDRGSMKKIDSDTIDALQLLAPGISRTDAKTARGRILGGQAFAEFSDEERRVIWSRCENFDRLVPSLHTFFEDFKYLESCGHCVKRLFGQSTESVWKTMSSMFIPSSDVESVVQTSESTFRCEQSADAEGLEKGYLQIWLYAMRHYPLIPPDPKKDDDLLAKPTRAKADERAIYEMAELARRLGFESPEIKAIIESSPDHQIARVALLQARKPNRFRYDAQQFDNLVSRIVDCFAAAVPTQPEVVHDLLADCTVKPRARCGMPRMGTHKQDSPLLFLDRVHADDVEAADNITTFFVRRCVYFAFFGKPARPVPTDYGQTGEPDGYMPRSPLFVGEDGPSGDYESASHVAERRELPPQERRGLNAGRDGKQQALRRLPVARGGRERKTLKKRRKWNALVRSGRRRPTDEGSPDHMELELQNTEDSDRGLSLVRPPSPALPDADLAIAPRVLPDESPRFERWTLTPQPSAHGPITSQEEDTNSQCTRVSLDEELYEHDLAETLAMNVLPQASDPLDQTRIDRSPSEPGDSEPLRADPGGQEQDVDTYIDHLMRAQEEQERLEEQLEQERLESELGLSQHEQRTPEQSAEFLERQNSLPRTPNNDLAGPTQDSLPASRHEGQPAAPVEDQEHVVTPPAQGSSTDAAGPTTVEAPQPPPGFVEISFWTFERGDWRQSDCLKVDPSDPSLVERVAKKYTWKHYSLYDRELQSLSPAQCYRAATSDGNNAVFLISEDEEKKLAAEGEERLRKDKQLLLSASRVLERAESESKRRQLLRFMKSAP